MQTLEIAMKMIVEDTEHREGLGAAEVDIPARILLDTLEAGEAATPAEVDTTDTTTTVTDRPVRTEMRMTSSNRAMHAGAGQDLKTRNPGQDLDLKTGSLGRTLPTRLRARNFRRAPNNKRKIPSRPKCRPTRLEAAKAKTHR